MSPFVSGILDTRSLSVHLPGQFMSDRSKIEWTDATWNPVRGCTKVSPGCAHCYAETFAERFRGVPGHPYELSFTHISLLTEVLTVINLPAIFHNNVHLCALSTEPNEHTITV